MDTETIEMVQEIQAISPDAWNMVLAWAKAEAITSLVVAVFMLLVFIGGIVLLVKGFRHDETGIWVILSLFPIGIGGPLFVLKLVEYIHLTLAPQMRALERLQLLIQ